MADKETPSFLISIRFLLAILAFVAYAAQYTQKINMSVAIVCMVKHTANESYSITSNVSSILANSDSSCEASVSKKGKQFSGEFEWSKQLQGLILSAYFIGYLITEIPGLFLY